MEISTLSARAKQFVQIYDKISRTFTSRGLLYPLTPREIKLINKFLENYQNESVDFFEKFLTFQLSTRKGGDTSVSVPMGWVLSKAAILRWKNRKEGSNFFLSKNQKKVHIKPIREKFMLSSDYKNLVRKRAANTVNGWIDCRELELYSPTSPICTHCKNSDICSV